MRFFAVAMMSVALTCTGFSEDVMRSPRILNVTKMGNPILARPAARVENPAAPEIRQIVEDMLATANDMPNCAGLAAPQVSIPLRIVLISVPGENGEVAVPLTALINPKWEPLSEEQEERNEGCLSLPGLMGPVFRFKSIRYTFQNIDGKTETREVCGFHARVVQHECDHLDGKLYVSQIKDISRLAYVEEVAKQAKHQREKTIKG